MIKSILTVKENNKSNQFPLLARLKKTKDSKNSYGTVVLFTDKRVGMVVFPSSVYEVGHYDTIWCNCFEEKTWEILPPGSSINLVVK